ncbi:MAG: hypothetical protein ED859_17150 [Desulfuromonadales bacterium]|nr:MAG: hypothetical protein ED859_17150 [Desulfuromonadales bacterium]
MPDPEEHTRVASSPESPKHIDRLYYSPVFIVAGVVVCAFVSEYLVMGFLSHFKLLDSPLHQIKVAFPHADMVNTRRNSQVTTS